MGVSTAYQLPWPEASEVADVPTDMRELAQKVDTELGKKLDTASSTYQRRILVETSLPATANENDICFLVTG